MSKFLVPAKEVDLNFDNILVETSDKDVRECVNLFEHRKKTTNDLNTLLKRVKRNLMKYSRDELLKYNSEMSKEWFEWADDLIIFFSCRYVLDRTPIPRYL